MTFSLIFLIAEEMQRENLQQPTKRSLSSMSASPRLEALSLGWQFFVVYKLDYRSLSSVFSRKPSTYDASFSSINHINSKLLVAETWIA